MRRSVVEGLGRISLLGSRFPVARTIAEPAEPCILMLRAHVVRALWVQIPDGRIPGP
jgi:hypothetical protein